MIKIVPIISLILLTSCTFVGDPETYGENGFLMGLWHGSVAIGAQVISIFKTEVGIYSFNNSGWFYDLFFLIGVIFLSWNIGILASIISFFILIS